MSQMTWSRPAVVPPPSEETAWPADSEALPAATATIYVDLDAGVQGVGTQLSPYNDLPGMSSSDVRVNPGTRVVARGRLKAFGLLRRSGTLAQPVVYDGRDPAWGTLYAEAHDDLPTAACADAPAALGNPAFASLRRAVIAGPATDWQRGLYDNRVPGTLARFPDLADEELYDYDRWYGLSYAEASWYPGTADGQYVKAQSVGRIDIMALPEVERMKVLAARRAQLAPVLMIRFSGNALKEFPAYFADEDGTANPTAGLYLVGSAPHGMTPYSTASGFGRWAVGNLPMAVTRPGRYAQSPADGWALHWPRGAPGLIQRATLATGMTLAGHIRIIGWQFSGFTGSPALRVPTAVAGLWVRRCVFHGSTQLSKTSVLDLAAGVTDFVVAHNTFRRTTRGAQLRVGAARNGRISCNHFEHCGDTALNVGSASNAVNLLIEGNYIWKCNGGHGNQLTLYATPYNVVIRGNVSVDGARPFTMELGANGYADIATAGAAPGLRLEANLLMTNGVSSAAWGLMLQDGTAIQGLVLQNNRIDGGPQAKAGFMGLGNSAATCAANGNTLLGALSTAAAACIPGGSNFLLPATGSTAEALRADWANDNVDPGLCLAVGA